MPRVIRPLPIRPVTPAARRWWGVAQAAVLVATIGLLVALLLRPGLSLVLLWRGLVPILALTLLLAPHVWRNVCPLATVSMLGRGPGSGRPLPPGRQPLVATIAIVLFLVAIILRRSVFETDGTASAGLIGGALVLAGTVGRLGERKAGFCNAICPVGPVERLLGQYAQFNPGNPRCEPCTLCTPRGCLDLALDKTPAQLLGRARRSAAWLGRPTGAFGVAFPGIVAGWGVAGLAGWGIGGTAMAVAGGGALTWLAGLAAVRRGVGSAAILRSSALVAAVLYACFAWPVAFASWRQLLGG